MALSPSLARPGANVTGIKVFCWEVTAKRLRLLHELVPQAVRIAVLVNPGNASISETTLREAQDAASTLGLEIRTLKATWIIGEIDGAFLHYARAP